MLDIRATHYSSPHSEVEFASVPLSVGLYNASDEPGLISGTFRIYNGSTGLLLHTSDIIPITLTAGASAIAAALTDFTPPAPADNTYFVLFDALATNSLVPDGIGIHLGAFYFDVKPVGMGPAPAAHAPTHEIGGSDFLTTENLSTASADQALMLSPDGAGGVRWAAVPTAKGAFAEATNDEPTPDADTYSQYALTALDQAADFQNPTGTFADGQKLIIRILDDSTPRALTWGAAYASRGATLPSTTVAGKTHYIGLIYNTDLGTWDCVAATVEA